MDPGSDWSGSVAFTLNFYSVECSETYDQL